MPEQPARREARNSPKAMVMVHSPVTRGNTAITEEQEPLDQRILIPLGISLKQRIEDYRFDRRHNSVCGAVRYLIELGLEAERWRDQKKPPR